MKFFPILLLGCLACFTLSCDDEDDNASPNQPTEFTGTPVAIGDGEAWTRVTVGPDGEPTAVAAVFTRGALQNLPVDPNPPHAHEFTLAMPGEVSVAPYDHVTLDWNEFGHEPPGVYDVPHFDVHFYFIDGPARDLITPNDTAGFNRPLPAAMLAPMYLETPGGVPRMGAHVIDLMSPEIAGTGVFNHTFIYGKFDAELTFLEPMVAISSLDSDVDIEATIRRPDNYGRSGHFPGKYTITYDEATDTYSVSLSDLEERL
jgi:hypothetical protein